MENQNDTLEILKKVQLFDKFHSGDLKDLLRVIQIKEFPQNHIIIKEGDDADGLWIIVKGICNVNTISPEGNEIELALLSDYSYFGEMALIEDIKRTANVKTKTQCLFYFLGKYDFEILVSKNNEIASKIYYNIARILSKRLREIDKKFSSKEDELYKIKKEIL